MTVAHQHTPQARQMLNKLLVGRLVFTPRIVDGEAVYEFKEPDA